MVSLQARFLFRGTIALAFLLAIGSSSISDEIMYSFDFHYAAPRYVLLRL